jgi:phosphotriesterase-related protein
VARARPTRSLFHRPVPQPLIGLGRDPLALKKVANATGLNIIMGSGWYQRAYHPNDMDRRTVEDLADEIIQDITVGVNHTGIRAGIIGEVGINGDPITPNEEKISGRRLGPARRLELQFHSITVVPAVRNLNSPK